MGTAHWGTIRAGAGLVRALRRATVATRTAPHRAAAAAATAGAVAHGSSAAHAARASGRARRFRSHQPACAAWAGGAAAAVRHVASVVVTAGAARRRARVEVKFVLTTRWRICAAVHLAASAVRAPTAMLPLVCTVITHVVGIAALIGTSTVHTHPRPAHAAADTAAFAAAVARRRRRTEAVVGTRAPYATATSATALHLSAWAVVAVAVAVATLDRAGARRLAEAITPVTTARRSSLGCWAGQCRTSACKCLYAGLNTSASMHLIAQQ